MEFCLGHGDKVGGHYRAWAAARSGEVQTGIEHAKQVSDVEAPQVYQPAVAEDAYPTRFVEERATAFLERHAAIDERQLLIETTTQYPYLGFDDLVTVHTLVDARWRLSVWQGCDWGELYDLAQDPFEAENLWDAPQAAAAKTALLLQLVHLMQDHQETSPYPLSVS